MVDPMDWQNLHKQAVYNFSYATIKHYLQAKLHEPWVQSELENDSGIGKSEP